jgi:sec-independent protein translocase protein TatC
MTDGPSGEMPFLDHLEELRYRLLWAVGALGVAMMLAFAVILRPSFDIIGYFAAPILPILPDHRLIYTNPVDPVTIRLKIAFGFGLVFAAPIILYQVWAFLSPALHRHEKKLVLPVIGGATILFATGVWVGWKFALPVMLDVLGSFQAESMQMMITATEYFSFMVTICLAFGGVMQLPIVIMALTALGLVTPSLLARFRRHAMAGSIVVSAIITPGDLITMTVVMAVPLYALYEVSIVVSWITHRTRERRLRRAAAAESIGGASA